MKKFLFITYCFPPQLSAESILIAKFVRHIRSEGWQPFVVCADSKTTFESEDLELLEYIPRHEIRIVKVRSNERSFWARAIFHFFPFLSKLPDSKLPWYLPACRKIKAIIESNEFDLIFSRASFLTSNLAGLYAKKISGSPWIVHFSDPWVDSPYKKYNRFNLWMNRKLEAKVLKNADAVIFVSEETRDLVTRKYSDKIKAKSYVVPHYFDPELYSRTFAKGSKKFIISHLGGFYGTRTPIPLFQALDQLLKEAPELRKILEVRLIGSSATNFIENAEKLNLCDVIKFLPPVSYLKSLELMMESNVLLLIDAPAATNVFLPSKLIDYIYTKKPILGITPIKGASANLIRKLNNIVVEPDDIEGIANSLKQLCFKHLNHNFSDYLYSDADIQEYDVRNTTKKIAAIFNDSADAKFSGFRNIK